MTADVPSAPPLPQDLFASCGAPAVTSTSTGTGISSSFYPSIGPQPSTPCTLPEAPCYPARPADDMSGYGYPPPAPTQQWAQPPMYGAYAAPLASSPAQCSYVPPPTQPATVSSKPSTTTAALAGAVGGMLVGEVLSHRHGRHHHQHHGLLRRLFL